MEMVWKREREREKGRERGRGRGEVNGYCYYYVVKNTHQQTKSLLALRK